MGPSSRRFVAGLVRLGLAVLAIALVGGYISRHLPGRRHMRLESEAPPPDSLGPGDLRIYNADSSVDLILQGDRIFAGLSPITVAKIRRRLESETSKDTSGLGGSISKVVKQSVAGAIDTHAAYRLADIEDIRYEDDKVVIDWKDGGRHELFGSMKVDGKRAANSFRREDAERFIQVVRERMGLPPFTRN